MDMQQIGKFLIQTFRSEKYRYTAALCLSIAAHIALYAYYSPEYEDVKDMAIEFELVGSQLDQPIAPDADGPRNLQPETPPEDEAPESLEALPPEPPTGMLVGDTDLIETSPEDTNGPAIDTETGRTDSESDSASTTDSETTISDTSSETDATPDTDTHTDLDTSRDTESETTVAQHPSGASDTDSSTDTNVVAAKDSDSATDSSGGGQHQSPESAGAQSADDGVCLHDVFAYGKTNPKWMAWLSMTAFAGTRYEKGLAGILGSFYLYNEMVSATEIDPLTELEGVLVSADEFADFETYQVVTTYNVGQEVLKGRLQKNLGANPKFSLSQNDQGVSGVLQDGYRWDMVGSGRVMVASDAEKGKLQPGWPSQVTCMMPLPEFGGDSQKQFNALIRTKLGPASSTERWPVLMVATRDPYAVGLHNNPELAKMFQWAIVKGYFSDPIQIQGEVKFKGSASDMVRVEYMVKYLLKKADYLKYLGLGNIAEKITYTIEGDTLYFTAPFTEKQMVVALLVLQSYSKMLNDHFTQTKK